MNMGWLLRMAKWARHPPSMRQVRIGAVVLALVLAVWGLDLAGLWPDWARADKVSRVPRL